MMLSDSQVQDILSRGGYVAAEDLTRAATEAAARRTSLVERLLADGLLTKDLLGQAIAEHHGIPYADLNSHPPSRDAILRIPEALARERRVVVFTEHARTITIATDTPAQEGLDAALATIVNGKKIRIAYGLPEDLDNAFFQYRQELATRVTEILAVRERIAPELFTAIIADALALHASDVHIEPQEGSDVAIRFRIDGVLREVARIPATHYLNILNRMKVLAHLRTDEHATAQDGAIRFSRPDGDAADLRVSVVPTLDGEKVVCRLLAEYVRGFTLADLGLPRTAETQLTAAAGKPFGMIIVCGPTGSGKTTTLYAVVRALAGPGVNVTTIEDPVEYRVPGVNQIQVNPQTNLTFAHGLRSIVRQDPDIVLVGEIRDRETAEIAVNAALTGHLLLSTFHANDAASAIPRLCNMGIEPYLLASTLDLIVAQRLVRIICEGCRHTVRVPRAEVVARMPGFESLLGDAARWTTYVGKGCTLCGGSGYRGRTGVFETIVVTPEIRELLPTRPTAAAVWALAASQGAQTMFGDGIAKVQKGITTFDELVRVVAPPMNADGVQPRARVRNGDATRGTARA